MKAERLPRVLELRPIAAVMDFARDWIARFIGVQGIDRSMAIAAQSYTALFPLLIVYASVLPSDRDFADVLIQRFELTGAAAESVERAFAPSGDVRSSVTVVGAGLLLVSALSFTRGLQRLYESSFGLPTLGMRNTKWGLLWLVIGTTIFVLTVVGIFLLWALWGILTIWYLYRVIRGWLRLNDRRPAPD